MRIVDCHVHARDNEMDADQILREMDKAGVERILLLSIKENSSSLTARKNMLAVKKIKDRCPERISALAWIEPTLPGAKGLAKEVMTEWGFSGLKIIPNHYYVSDPELEPFWEAVNDIAAPILFHTGILWSNDDCSRYTRPVYMEKLMHYPKIKFAMAHIAWPWCEECIAVFGRMLSAANIGGFDVQSYIDLTPGTPGHIRKQAIQNAVSYCGDKFLMFGTDCCVPKEALGDDLKFHIDRDKAIFDELGLTREQQERIFSGTADELFPAVI